MFNILLVFLPIAAVLYLDIYEEQLLIGQEKSMVQQGRLLSAALSQQGDIDQDKVRLILTNLANRTETRLRVVDREGWLLGDTSREVGTSEKPEISLRKVSREYSVEEVIDKESLLYKWAVYPIVLYRNFFNPPLPVDDESYYSATTQFLGKEIQAALDGKYGAVTRLSSGGQRSVTLYTAIPVFNDDIVVGAVLSSQSTYRILKDLYDIRLFILKIFLASFIAALVISLFLSRTISFRIKKLSREAKIITTGKGRIKGSFTPMKLNDEIGNLSYSLNDLTSRLDRHIQFIDSLSRDISHEFKNPLAVISSATEMISRSDGPRRERFIEMINQNTRRMESLLDGIEEISRLDSHMDKEEKGTVDILELLGTLQEGFKLQYPSLNWKICCSMSRVFLGGTAERLSQVFVNLYENASNFSTEKGNIETVIRTSKFMVEIAVSNDGPKIPPEDLEKIFQRFFTSREKDKSRHHGLGLSISRTIVEAYGGTIHGENSKSGAVFIIKLPLVTCRV
jgi:two-component system sensor histidine kinase ChvG